MKAYFNTATFLGYETKEYKSTNEDRGMDRKYVILIIVLLAILCWQLIQYNKLLAEYNSMKKSLSEISSSQNCSLLKEEYESLLSKYNSLNEKCSQVERRIEPYFCPEDHCSSVVIRWISRANESIDIAIYSFTLDSIGDALIKARERGVKIRVIFERDQVNQWSEYSRLKSAGIPVMLDENPAYMHNKFMVIDGKVVLTGSYNYSKQADTQNDENLIVIVDETTAKAYEDEFNEMWGGKFGS